MNLNIDLQRQNESLAFRVMELEAELELRILKQIKSGTPYSGVTAKKNITSGPINTSEMKAVYEKLAASEKKIDELKKNLADANKKYRNVTFQYSELKKENMQGNNVKGIRKVAYIYSKYGFIGIIKKIAHRMKGNS